MKTLVNIGVLLLVAAFLFLSCQKKEEYPPIPSLEFYGGSIFHDTVNNIDTAVILLFYYTDGDGNIGMADIQDSTQPANFIVNFYKLVNGKMTIGTLYNDSTFTYDTINFNARLPFLAPPGYTGWIKGTIEDTIRIYPTTSNIYDTIMFKAFITDRDGNKSDTASTDIIRIKNR